MLWLPLCRRLCTHVACVGASLLPCPSHSHLCVCICVCVCIWCDIFFRDFFFAELSTRVDSVKGENEKLKSENVILTQYIENLMPAQAKPKQGRSSASSASKR
eukprot:m.20819 g.20819  ORF g.20819 m.20819 type:complete len:103 (+) comp3831_c0_seq2:169-477(+)